MRSISVAIPVILASAALAAPFRYTIGVVEPRPRDVSAPSEAINWDKIGDGVLDGLNIAAKVIRSDGQERGHGHQYKHAAHSSYRQHSAGRHASHSTHDFERPHDGFYSTHSGAGHSAHYARNLPTSSFSRLTHNGASLGKHHARSGRPYYGYSARPHYGASHSSRADESEAINWTDVGEGVGDVAKIATKFLRREPEPGFWTDVKDFGEGAVKSFVRADEESEAINWTDVGEGVGDVAKIATKFLRREPEPSFWGDVKDFGEGAAKAFVRREPGFWTDVKDFGEGAVKSFVRSDDSEAINWTDVGEGVGDVAKIATKFIRAEDDSEAINWTDVGEGAGDVAKIAAHFLRSLELNELD